MEKYLFGFIGVLLLFIAGIGLYAVVQHPQETANLAPQAVAAVGNAVQTATTALTTPDNAGTAETSNQNSGGTKNSTTGTYTMAQVKAHNDASSCYTTINGGVYDLTQWIDQHPGGREAILSLCGTDGAHAFEAQHGGQAEPEQELASLKIGTLSK